MLGPWIGEALVAADDRALIAHRGASAYAPEHTLGAYELAIEQGADYIEQDLQISLDGVLVCLHDRTLERTTNVEQVFPTRFRRVKENGRELKRWFVVDFTLEELKQLDAGSWFDPKFSGASIATFQEAIDLIKGRAGLYPELKDPEFYREEGFEMEGLFYEALKKNNLHLSVDSPGTPVVIQSFSENVLRRLRFDLDCSLPLVYLFGDLPTGQEMSTERLDEIHRFASGIGPNKKLLLEDPELVERAHAAGLTVTPYTFRSASVQAGFKDVQSEMSHFLYELGVDALFTDNPDQFPRAPSSPKTN
jgi:glycerophosphoryl diester phosphodiesterase